MIDYKGYTHKLPLILLPLWKKIFCKRDWHLWDEVWTFDKHYLHCDACEISCEIVSQKEK